MYIIHVLGFYLTQMKRNFCYCSEQEILRKEFKSQYAVRGRLGQRIQELEEELERVREEAEHTAEASKSDDEVCVSFFFRSTLPVPFKSLLRGAISFVSLLSILILNEIRPIFYMIRGTVPF